MKYSIIHISDIHKSDDVDYEVSIQPLFWRFEIKVLPLRHVKH